MRRCNNPTCGGNGNCATCPKRRAEELNNEAFEAVAEYAVSEKEGTVNCDALKAGNEKGNIYAIAIDLGTTTLAFSLVNIVSKQILHIPCPSCGTTRSVISIIKGDFLNAVLINPLGYIAIISLVIIPIWIIFDCSTGKSTLVNTYHACLRFIKKAYIYIPLIILTICNWIWNIVKYT